MRLAIQLNRSIHTFSFPPKPRDPVFPYSIPLFPIKRLDVGTEQRCRSKQGRRRKEGRKPQRLSPPGRGVTAVFWWVAAFDRYDAVERETGGWATVRIHCVPGGVEPRYACVWREGEAR